MRLRDAARGAVRTGTAPSGHPEAPLWPPPRRLQQRPGLWTGPPPHTPGPRPIKSAVFLYPRSVCRRTWSSGALSVFRLGLFLRGEGWPRKSRGRRGPDRGEAPCGCCLLSRFQNLSVLIPGAQAAVPWGVIELPGPLDTPTLESPASSQEGWVGPTHTRRGRALAPGRRAWTRAPPALPGVG